MTSPISAVTDRKRPVRPTGFTLIEMLVIVGILVALAGILLPSVMRAYNSSARAAQAADLQAIATALEAYKQDHRDYPRVLGAPTNPDDYKGYKGAAVLCQALIGPTDLDD